MTLAEAVASIPGFSSWNHAAKIKYFAWFLHTERGRSDFRASDIQKCYDELHMAQPTQVGPFLAAMESRKPKQALKVRNGYKLEQRVRESFDQKYGRREITVVVEKMLAELPAKIKGIDEQAYLNEALTCFKSGAFRASIVMTWNLAYDHFLRWIYNDAKRLSDFNTQLPLSFKKADITAVQLFEDFAFLKESQVLTVAKSANLISPSRYTLMKGKLDDRNTSAHPSGIAVHQVTAEAYIKDLVENVVLKLT